MKKTWKNIENHENMEKNNDKNNEKP